MGFLHKITKINNKLNKIKIKIKMIYTKNVK